MSNSNLDTPQVRLTHPDRVVYSEQGLTKRDLADYYMQLADFMLPHVADRVLTLVRCPEGRNGECFFQKHYHESFPAPVRSVTIQERHKSAEYMVIDDALGLASLVQMGTLEIHGWGARADRPERPDRLVFDLDPGTGVSWSRVVQAARTVRQRLLDLGLESFVKTTGGKGLHVVAPIERRADWDTAKAFSRATAESIAEVDPEQYLVTASKEERKGRLFIDYLRNSRGATSVCPYSTRARPGAPVSMPLAWRELDEDLDPSTWNVPAVLERLSQGGAAWGDYSNVRQTITKSMRQAVGLAA